MEDRRRWYDNDPILSEAMELLSLSTGDTKDQAVDFILKLQEQVASDVIERVYEAVSKYSGKAGRWYDNDPTMLKAIELLREASPNVQRLAAKKILKVLTNNECIDIESEIQE